MLLPLLAASVFLADTKLILLGTGTPNADPDRFGPSVAVVVNDTPYIVDFGPGVVRRAAAAKIKPEKLKTAFATHLHSDHTAGLPDLILTPAVLDRHAPLLLFGPTGIKSMSEHILKAYEQDIDIRTRGLENGDAKAYIVDAREIKPGIIYKDDNVTVKAFAVRHGQWKEAYGFRFETKDKTIVISGDCGPDPAIVEACNGCDILLHEVYSVAGFKKRPSMWQKYHSNFHTSTVELGEIANKAKPKLLVLYHQLVWSSNEQELLQELRSVYKGPVAYGADLSVY